MTPRRKKFWKFDPVQHEKVRRAVNFIDENKTAEKPPRLKTFRKMSKAEIMITPRNDSATPDKNVV